MILEDHIQTENLSSTSGTSGFVWEQFDFEMCNRHLTAVYIWAFCTVLCFALGFPASIAILWDMFKSYRRGTPLTPNNFFVLNLSIMDFVFLAFVPPGILDYFIWKISELDAIWNAVFSLNVCGRPLMMACICLDCYLAVVHPVIYHKRRSLTPRVVMAAVIWTVTVAMGIIYCLYFRVFTTIIAIMPSILTVVIIGMCDFFILRVLVKSDPGRKNIHPQKRKAIQTLINSLVMTVFSYLPPIIMIAVGNSLINQEDVLYCFIIIPVSITSISGSAIMPLLHLSNNGKLDCFRLRCRKKSFPSFTKTGAVEV